MNQFPFVPGPLNFDFMNDSSQLKFPTNTLVSKPTDNYQAPMPTPTPKANGNGLGLGNNPETWLAGLALLGGAMQPTRVGETASGNFGKALIGAAQMFGNVKAAGAKGERENRALKLEEDKLAETKRQNIEPTDLDKSKTAYYDALAWAAKHPAAASSEAQLEALAKQEYINRQVKAGMSQKEAADRWDASTAKNPEMLGNMFKNIAVNTKASEAGIPAKHQAGILTDPTITALTSGKEAFPEKLDATDEANFKAALLNPKAKQFLENKYGADVVELQARRRGYWVE